MPYEQAQEDPPRGHEGRDEPVRGRRLPAREQARRLGGGVQADAMIDRLVHGAVRIDLGDVNVRKLLSEKK